MRTKEKKPEQFNKSGMSALFSPSRKRRTKKKERKRE
jgi:hypothetical protein